MGLPRAKKALLKDFDERYDQAIENGMAENPQPYLSGTI
jgi:hypothetical protein